MDINKHMHFVKSPAELHSLRDVLVKSKEYNSEKVFVCDGGGCIASGSKKVKDAFASQLGKKGLNEKLNIIETGCLGPCAVGPVVVIGKDDTFYQKVRPQDVKDIV